MYRFTFAQRKPLVNGWSGSPATRTARPSSTVTSMAHVSGQSWGHAPRTVPDMASGASGAIAGMLMVRIGDSAKLAMGGSANHARAVARRRYSVEDNARGRIMQHA